MCSLCEILFSNIVSGGSGTVRLIYYLDNIFVQSFDNSKVYSEVILI